MSPLGGDGDDLELSLRLQTAMTGKQEMQIGQQEMNNKDRHQDKLQDVDLSLVESCKMPRVDPRGVPSLSSMVSSNRSKTRVSVRARVEGATVSFFPLHLIVPTHLGVFYYSDVAYMFSYSCLSYMFW